MGSITPLGIQLTTLSPIVWELWAVSLSAQLTIISRFWTKERGSCHQGTCFNVSYVYKLQCCIQCLVFHLWIMESPSTAKKIICTQSKSRAKIKRLNRLLAKLDVIVRTEQGHPLLPELFKCYIHGLSEALNSDTDCVLWGSKLGDVDVSHLLWADDLILLALIPSLT